MIWVIHKIVDKSYIKLSNLGNHTRIYTEQKRHKCDWCDKSLRNSSLLWYIQERNLTNEMFVITHIYTCFLLHIVHVVLFYLIIFKTPFIKICIFILYVLVSNTFLDTFKNVFAINFKTCLYLIKRKKYCKLVFLIYLLYFSLSDFVMVSFWDTKCPVSSSAVNH